MRKTLLVLLVAGIFTTGCEQQTTSPIQEAEPVQLPEITDTDTPEPIQLPEVNDEDLPEPIQLPELSEDDVKQTRPIPIGDTTRVSLDWNGIYEGVLPCASCAGITTVIELEMTGTYTIIETFMGEENTEPTVTEGNILWNDAGNTVTLNDRQYFVGENHLIHLDNNGNRITGDLASDYVLRK